MTMEDVAKRAETMPWGTADEVRDRIIEAVKRTGAEVVHVRMNTGAMPQEMFLNQIRLFAEKVLPALQAYKVTVRAGGGGSRGIEMPTLPAFPPGYASLAHMGHE